MKKFLICVMSLLLLVLTGCSMATDENTLYIGMECNYQPFNRTIEASNGYSLPIDNSKQHADGYDVQIAKIIGEMTGKKVVIKKTIWDSLIPDLNNGVLDLVLAGMTATPERREEIDFTDPYLRSDLAFLVSTENLNKDFPGNSKDNPASYEDLLKAFDGHGLVCQMNVVGDGFIDTYFKDNNQGYKINHNKALETYPAAANDVKSGNAYAMPAELPVVEAMTNLGGLSVLYVDQNMLKDEDKDGLSVSIGIKKGNKALVDEINGVLAQISDQERAKLMGEAAARSAGGAQGETLTVGMECNYQPFNWTLDKNNGFALPIHGSNQFADGYDVQVAKFLGEKLNRKVVIKKTVWDSLIPDLNNGNLDIVLAGMTATPERREEIDFTDPYLRSDLAFLVSTENLNKDFPGNSKDNPASYEDLLKAFDGHGLVCQMNVVGDGFIDTYFKDNNQGYKINHNKALETYPTAANDVKSGNAYAMPAELPVIEAMTNLGGLSVLYVDQSFLSADDKVGLTVSIGVKKGNTELLAQLNSALSQLSDSDRANLMGAAASRSAEGGTTTEGAPNKYVTIFTKYSSWIISGVITTLILAIFGTGVGLIIGIFIAYGKNIIIRDTDKKYMKVLKRICLVICQIYSTVLRGTPMMVQALIFKYGCQAMGLNFEMIKFPPAVSDVLNGWLIAGLIVITLNTSAYMAEIVKSGLNGVDQGQVEGAKSLGMSNARTSFSIILPQALRNCLPTIGNELIVNIKDSSVLNVIAVSELFYRIKDIASTSYAFFECYIVVACIYLILTLLATGVLKLIERKMDGVKFSYNPFRKKEEF